MFRDFIVYMLSRYMGEREINLIGIIMYVAIAKLSENQITYINIIGLIHVDPKKYFKYLKECHGITRIMPEIYNLTQEEVQSVIYLHLYYGRLGGNINWFEEAAKRKEEPAHKWYYDGKDWIDGTKRISHSI